MTDGQRIAKGVRDGDTMLGPIERHRCDLHPSRWMSYRWTWPVPEDGDHLAALEADGWPQSIRACSDCDAADSDD